MLKLIMAVPIVLLVASLSFSQTYQLHSDVVDDGGSKMTSSGYILRGSFGQPTIGKISSAGYAAYIGFWHPAHGSGTGVEEDFFVLSHVPMVFSLSQNYPNPVSSSTTIQYSLPRETSVDLEVFNAAGQRVRVLASEKQEPGYYKVNWDLRGVSGQRIPNGVYFYRLRGGDFIRTMKMVIMR